MEKPIIILSCDVADDGRMQMRQEYFTAIADAGGIPVVMPPYVERSKIDEWVDRIGASALVLTGGADLDPQLYRERPVDGLGRVSLTRDVYELELFDCAMRRGLPVLGICRGLQVINVALGGSLYQDMPTQMGEEFVSHSREDTLHEVAFTSGSELERLVGKQFVLTNTHHHQCIHRVADELTVSGTTVDGVVESVEWPEHSIVGVQFHPERMTDDSPEMARFFEEWVRMVSEKDAE